MDLLNDVNKEIEDSLFVHYVAFLTGDWNLQMEAYLYHRVYNSDVVDLVIFALSNLSARICELYTVEDSGSVKKAFVITPWKEERAKLAREKPTLSLLFRGKHYDPLLNIDLVSSALILGKIKKHFRQKSRFMTGNSFNVTKSVACDA